MIYKIKTFIVNIIVIYNCLLCQTNTIKGRVFDNISKLPISGVSIQINEFGTTTNSDGFFKLSIKNNILENSYIRFSHVGYNDLIKKIDDKTYFQIELEYNIKPLKEVKTNNSTVFDIVLKAVKKIPQNYYMNDIWLNGLFKTKVTLSNNNLLLFINQLKSKINIYYPKYNKTTELPTIFVIKKKSEIFTDSSKNYLFKFLIHNSYNSIGLCDFVHLKSDFISENGYKNYTYISKGKATINERRVINIEFYKKNSTKKEGSIYIDTATYAFVGFNYVRYNIQYPFFYILKDVYESYYNIDSNQKWKINHINYYQRSKYKDSSQKLELTAEFYTLKSEQIDSNSNNSKYKLNLVHFIDEVPNIGTNKEWDSLNIKFDKYFLQSDTLPFLIKNYNLKELNYNKVHKKNKILYSVLDYFSNSIKFTLSFKNNNIYLSKNQPLVNKKLDYFSNINYYSSIEYKLYKNYYFGFGEDNLFYNNNKILNSNKFYYLCYNFKNKLFNNGNCFTPILGINTNRISLDEKYIDLEEKNYFIGLRTSFRISIKYRLGYFIQANYFINDYSRLYNTDLNYKKNNFNFSVGLLTY